MYPLMDVKDNLTRIVQGKEQRRHNIGSSNAYSAINEQIAQKLLEKNDQPIKLLRVKPGSQAVAKGDRQRYAPHQHAGTHFYYTLRVKQVALTLKICSNNTSCNNIMIIFERLI